MIDNKINIFTTIDESWLPYACMMIKSVKDNTSSELNYWIIHEDITSMSQQTVLEWAKAQGINIEFVYFPEIQSRPGNEFLSSLPTSQPYSRTTFWGRYFGGQCLPAGISRAIYADVDMIAVGSLAPLMAIDLGCNSVGAVRLRDSNAATNLGLDIDKYFNNGMLVFDFEKFDALKLVGLMAERLKSGGLYYGPQCAFNHAAQGLIKPLDDCWNVQGEIRPDIRPLATLTMNQMRLIHFTGALKPWAYLSTDPLRQYVKRYIEETPFPEAWEPDHNFRNRVHRLARKIKRFATSACHVKRGQ